MAQHLPYVQRTLDAVGARNGHVPVLSLAEMHGAGLRRDSDEGKPMNYAGRLRVKALYSHSDGIPCACVACTKRRLIKERDLRRAARRPAAKGVARSHEARGEYVSDGTAG